MLLRIAIGWHFFYEGWSKFETYQYTAPPAKHWSAEGYFRNASGPLAPYYRRLLGDPGSLEALAVSGADDAQGLEQHIIDALEQDWKAYLEQFGAYYQLTEERKQAALGRLDETKKQAQQWLGDNRAYVADYLAALRRDREREQQIGRMSAMEREQLQSELKGLQAQRDYLAGKFNEWTVSFRSSLDTLLTPEQRERHPPGRTKAWDEALGARPSLAEWRPVDWWAWWRPIDWANFLTVYGLMVMGACLALGFFTRLAALAAVVFLASLYLAMPPWPGLPGTDPGTGHYLIVNPHVIEMLAVLAAAGSGRWVGLDAIIRRLLFGRRKTEARVEAAPPPPPPANPRV